MNPSGTDLKAYRVELTVDGLKFAIYQKLFMQSDRMHVQPSGLSRRLIILTLL